jgi:hypothetical protein
MTDNIEDKLIHVLTNDPSTPLEVPNYGCLLIFKRPDFKLKYKGRGWAVGKITEFELENDANMSFVFRYWGVLNTYITNIYMEHPQGDVRKNGKTYIEYLFDPTKDLDFKYLFEKFVVEEIYNKRQISDDIFISAVMEVHSKWTNTTTIDSAEEEDLKNS